MKILRQTNPASTPLAVARVVAAAPLIGIGLQHVLGAAPLLPILLGTPIPMPEVHAAIGPWTQVLGGLMLLVGFFARAGGLLGAGAMAAALFAHVTFESYIPEGATEAFTWADEPPIALPILVLVASLMVAAGGAGRMSVDARSAS